MSLELPDVYWDYLEEDGRDSAFTDGQPGYFQLWSPQDLERMNREYNVPTLAPGFLGFGSNGGGRCSHLIATAQSLFCLSSDWNQDMRRRSLTRGPRFAHASGVNHPNEPAAVS